MIEELVSVIVPAYNTEKYIGDMIRCLLMQTYKNLQLIFVDDGSSDQTADIIKNQQDSRIEYYFQKNAGVSAARNFGISKAKGSKIFFFDSDDTFEPTLIERCIAFSKEKNVESVLYGYGNKVNGKVTGIHEFKLHGVYRNDQIVDEIMPAFIGRSFSDVNYWLKGERGLRDGTEHNALWRIMLDSSVINTNNIHFDTALTLGEDTKFINTYFLYTESVGILEETLYYLTIREGSANVTSNENPSLLAENKEKLIRARQEIDILAAVKGKSTHGYWQGTLVLSTVQLALRLSHDENRGGWRRFRHYLNNDKVQEAIKEFRPSLSSVKAIPFILLKLKMDWLLYGIMKMIPQKVVKKFMVI